LPRKETREMGKTQVGIIGCGNISDVYLKNMGPMFKNVRVAACADLIAERAQAKADEYDGVRPMTVKQLLAEPDIQIVVNLTIPKAHAEVSIAALEAGKHVYGEKPLALTREDGQRILALAEQKNLRVGCAPDTFLGGGLQTCRKLIEDGCIGRPVAATAFMMGHGPEGWHPDPEFFYKFGAGPMFDMGPYYLTAMISMLGPIRRVSGCTGKALEERVVSSEPKKGQKIAVEIPTHVAGVLDFAGGGIGTLVTSFDVWAHETPLLEVYGTTGSLSLPDPNFFDGPVRVNQGGQGWSEVPLTHPHSQQCRGLGVSDMAAAIEEGRPHRANGTMAYHVLDAMQAFHDASEQGTHVTLESTCEAPEPMPC